MDFAFYSLTDILTTVVTQAPSPSCLQCILHEFRYETKRPAGRKFSWQAFPKQAQRFHVEQFLLWSHSQLDKPYTFSLTESHCIPGLCWGSMVELVQFASERENTTSASLHRATIIDSNGRLKFPM
jgi:hypothetical protein